MRVRQYINLYLSIIMILNSSSLSLLLNNSSASSSSSSCRLREQFSLNGMYQKGDVILGGLFEVHYFTVFPELSFTSEPQQLYCEG